MKNQLVCKFAKAEVLLTFWDKLIGELQFKCSRYRDHEGNTIMRQLMLVPLEIKTRLFVEYIKKCKMMHNIAFF